MTKTVTLRLDLDKYNIFKRFASIDNRTLSNFIETATLRYIEEVEYVDDFEMEEIKNNKELLLSLKRGHGDVKKRRGKKVG